MKLFILLFALIFCSCQKEVSREGDFSRCGPIVAIDIWPPPTVSSIDVDFGGNLVRIDVGLLIASSLKVGDQYCK